MLDNQRGNRSSLCDNGEVMQVSKHHGLGNDFLIALLDHEPSDLADLARRMCDRRLGIGADGLIVGVLAPPAGDGLDAVMVLHNSDGSRAEMSGNGIRCLGHAIARRAGRAVDLLIGTDGGPRQVMVDGAGPTVQASVDMGQVGSGPGVVAEARAHLGEWRADTGDVGNPHLVVEVADPRSIDLAVVGPAIEAHYRDGINVEFIAPTPGEADALDFAVWERGAGITQACGTGASAAATLAARWGLVGDDVTVHMPGGDVRVQVGERATLIGPSTYVAAIEWPDWPQLLESPDSGGRART